MSVTPLRNQVFRVDLGHGAKPWLIVSNKARNRNLETVLAARITTTSRHANVPTVVALSSADSLVGYVVADDLIQLYRDELTVALGELSAETMRAVSSALRIAPQRQEPSRMPWWTPGVGPVRPSRSGPTPLPWPKARQVRAPRIGRTSALAVVCVPAPTVLVWHVAPTPVGKRAIGCDA